MKKGIVVGLLIGLAFVMGMCAQVPALTPGQWSVASSVLHTNCTATASLTTYCYAGDGLWVSTNGGAFVQIGAAPSGMVLSVNSTKPDASGNVVIKIPTQATGSVTLPVQ